MNQQLEPGRADMADITDWIRQGKALVHRRWPLFFGLTAIHIMLSYLTRQMGYLTVPLGLLITQSCYIVLLMAARHSDESKPLQAREILSLLHRLIGYCLLVSLISTAFILLALLFGTFMSPAVPARDYSDSPVFLSINWLAPGVVRFFFLYATFTIAGVWFLFPILSYLPLTLKESYLLARRAERKNQVVMMVIGYTPMFAFVLLLLVSEASLLAGTVFLPYFVAVQYVAYRQIFLQRRSNSPARALSGVVRTADSMNA
ncbi:MAG: hypothetical protein KTR32_18620 [Granulosicoccus sp.]|nr:hypothetical protein [Granulosicoccus sp.]